MAELVREGARTICFIKSRKAVELVARIVRERAAAAELERPRRALPRRLHAPAAPRARGAADQRRAAGGHHHRRARARHRHRRARRGGLRDVPGHRRLAAPDVGPRRAPRARAGRLRRRRGRAGPVLLPPPRRVPRAPGRGRDRLARERADPPRPPAVRRARGPAGRGATPRSLGPRWQAYADLLVSPGRARRAPRAVPAAPPRGLPGRARVAALGLARQRRGRRRLQRRAAGHGRDRRARANTIHDGAVYLHLGRSYEVARARPRRRGARSSTRSTATGTRSPRARPTWRSSACSTAARCCGVTLSFGRVTVTEQVHAYQRKRLPDHEVIDLQALDLPAALVHHAGALVRARAATSSRTSRPSCCSARCTPPSTRRSRCCRCWRCATAGTSAACRPTPTRRPAGRRSSSTTATPAASGSRCRASATSTCSSRDAHRLISECPCESGCPSCVQSPKCGNLNEPLSKAGALEVMARMLQR